MWRFTLAFYGVSQWYPPDPFQRGWQGYDQTILVQLTWFLSFRTYLSLNINICSTPGELQSNTRYMFIFFLLQIASADSSHSPKTVVSWVFLSSTGALSTSRKFQLCILWGKLRVLFGSITGQVTGVWPTVIVSADRLNLSRNHYNYLTSQFAMHLVR